MAKVNRLRYVDLDTFKLYSREGGARLLGGADIDSIRGDTTYDTPLFVDYTSAASGPAAEAPPAEAQLLKVLSAHVACRFEHIVVLTDMVRGCCTMQRYLSLGAPTF